MTQRCKYDEQVLDFVYGELSAAERAEFERHLPDCTTCPPQVHGFTRVRGEVRSLPRLEPPAESMQRMTALLMQEAAKVKPPVGKNGVSAHPPVEPGAEPGGGAGGGKLLELKPRGLRRILTHPATGVFAVAAAALLFVMLRPPGEEPASVSPPPPPPAIAAATPAENTVDKTAEPAGATAAAATDTATQIKGAPAVTTAEPQVEDAKAQKLALNEQKKEDGRLAFVPARGPVAGAGSAPTTVPGAAKDLAKPADAYRSTKAAGKASNKRDDSLDGLLVAEAERKPATRQFAQPPPESPPPALPTGTTTGRAGGSAAPMDRKGAIALADKSAGERRDAPADPNFAQPPPPPVAAAPPAKTPPRSDVGSELAARSRQRSVDELENQALAQAPSAGFDVNRSRSYQAGGGYAANTMGSSPKAEESNAGRAPSQVAGSDEDDAQNQAQTRNSAARRELNQVDEATRQLQLAQDHMVKGRCPEAQSVLARLEQSAPSLRGIAETRIQFQLRCSSRLQQQVVPQQQLIPQQQGPAPLAPNLPAPAAAPAPSAPMRSYEAQVPPPKPTYRASSNVNLEQRAKKAAAKPAPAKAKAAADSEKATAY